MRQRLKQVLFALANNGAKRVVIYGTGELAELAYLSLRETDLKLVGFVDGKEGRAFLSYPQWPIEALSNLDFDALLVTDLHEPERTQAQLVHAGVPGNKIIALVPKS